MTNMLHKMPMLAMFLFLMPPCFSQHLVETYQGGFDSIIRTMIRDSGHVQEYAYVERLSGQKGFAMKQALSSWRYFCIETSLHVTDFAVEGDLIVFCGYRNVFPVHKGIIGWMKASTFFLTGEYYVLDSVFAKNANNIPERVSDLNRISAHASNNNEYCHVAVLGEVNGRHCIVKGVIPGTSFQTLKYTAGTSPHHAEKFYDITATNDYFVTSGICYEPAIGSSIRVFSNNNTNVTCDTVYVLTNTYTTSILHPMITSAITSLEYNYVCLASFWQSIGNYGNFDGTLFQLVDASFLHTGYNPAFIFETSMPCQDNSEIKQLVFDVGTRQLLLLELLNYGTFSNNQLYRVDLSSYYPPVNPLSITTYSDKMRWHDVAFYYGNNPPSYLMSGNLTDVNKTMLVHAMRLFYAAGTCAVTGHIPYSTSTTTSAKGEYLPLLLHAALHAANPYIAYEFPLELNLDCAEP